MQVQTARETREHEIAVFMRTRGFFPCNRASEVAALHTLAGRLIPGPIASIEVLTRAQKLTGHSLFLLGDESTPRAFIAAFPLTEAGERAIRNGSFDARHIEQRWIAAFGPSTPAAYLWGLGGSDRAGAFAAMRALRIMRERFFAHTDLYARAATESGRRLMAGFGYRSFAGGRPDVLVSPRLTHRSPESFAARAS